MLFISHLDGFIIKKAKKTRLSKVRNTFMSVTQERLFYLGTGKSSANYTGAIEFE